jgi:hypothetical protein
MWLQVLLVEAELACGLALCLGLWPRVTRWAAQFLFGSFFAVALSQALGGERSCACFGKLDFHPWFAILLDAAILSALFLWKVQAKGPVDSFWCSYATIISLGVLLVFPVALLGLGRSKLYPRLEVSPATIQLGTIEQGGRRVFAVGLHNSHDSAIAIRHVQGSCPCLEAHEIPWQLEPREHKTVELSVDLTREPDFTGPLLIDVEGIAFVDTRVFAIRVQLNVAASPNSREISR